MLHETQASILTFLFNYILPQSLEKEMAPYSNIPAWRIHRQRSLVGYSLCNCGVAKSWTRLSDGAHPKIPLTPTAASLSFSASL